MLLGTYYAQNYASIIGRSLLKIDVVTIHILPLLLLMFEKNDVVALIIKIYHCTT